MSEECTSGSCSSCGESCEQRKAPQSLLEETNSLNEIKKVIGVVSGKGGVGKSLVTALLALEMTKKGYRTAILDADITGPSIPKMFGLTEMAKANEMGLLPEITQKGIEVMSVNLLLENESTPVVWRGPVISGTVKQFWRDVIWADVDFMFVDMPPGTGDVPLTVFQSLPVDGIVIVTSPQELVSMVVGKAVNMAKTMNIPILGIVENYSYLECPDCKTRISVFGESKIEAVSQEFQVQVLAKVPIDTAIAKACDSGDIESFKGDYLTAAANTIEVILK